MSLDSARSSSSGTIREAIKGLAWRSHAFARLFWNPQARCPVPHARPGEGGPLARSTAAFRRSPAFYLGFTLMAIVALGGLVVPLLTPYAPEHIIAGARLLAPSLSHPFGTDSLGRDMLSRVASGAQLAAQMAAVSVSISLVIGMVLGSLAGYYNGWVDQILSRTVDGWMALPGALVAVVIVARLGASLENLIMALGIMGVPAFYRMVRNTTLSARHMPYAEAAIALGATDRRVMWMHVFPNIMSSLVVMVTMRLGTALLMGSSLSFIGLGAQPPMPEWGSLLATGRNYLASAWWLAVFPGLAVTMTVVGLNLLGDGLRDFLDPRMGQARHHGGGTIGEEPPARRPASPPTAVEGTVGRERLNGRERARTDKHLVGISRH